MRMLASDAALIDSAFADVAIADTRRHAPARRVGQAAGGTGLLQQAGRAEADFRAGVVNGLVISIGLWGCLVYGIVCLVR